MKRRTQDEWRMLFAAQAESGLSAAAFCHGQGVDPKYFSVRRRQLLGEAVPWPRPAGPSAFVPVTVARSPEAVALEVGPGMTLRVPATVSPGWLAELLGALRG